MGFVTPRHSTRPRFRCLFHRIQSLAQLSVDQDDTALPNDEPICDGVQQFELCDPSNGRDDGPLALLIVNTHGSPRPGLLEEIVSELVKTHRYEARRCNFPDWDLMDEHAAKELLDLADRAAIVVLLGFSTPGLDKIFQLRAHQIVECRAVAGARSIAVLSEGEYALCIPSLACRIGTAWPFHELVLMAEDPTVAAAAGQCLESTIPVYSEKALRSAISGDADFKLVSTATSRQQVAVQIQPLWGRCGSTTAFENEIEDLVNAGYFVLRVFLEQHARRGWTLYFRMPGIVAENSVHAAAHLNSLAAPSRPDSEIKSNGSSVLDDFLGSVRARCDCVMQPVVAKLAMVATTVIVNHAVNLGFALQICPRARLLLDVHDYITRQAFERARSGLKSTKFANLAELAKMARCEAMLWSIPDFCTVVSESEQLRVSRHAIRSEIVLPRPYVAPTQAGSSQLWDVLVVADQHDFNIRSVRWFLDVIRSNPVLRRARVAIAGRAGSHISPREYGDLRGVRFLGFVPDLEQLRAKSRLSVIPDQAGTGIAIKTLTALAAAHPIVTTTFGTRGLPLTMGADIAAHDDAVEFAADIVRLLEDESELERRRQQSAAAYAKIAGQSSFGCYLSQLPEPDENTIQRRNDRIAQVLSVLPTRPESEVERPASYRARLNFRYGGNAQQALREGWHAGESWGRWMDGTSASLVFEMGSPLTVPLTVVMRIARSPARGFLAISINGTRLASRPVGHFMRWMIPESLTNGRCSIRIDFHSSTTYRWADHKNTPDQRIVGQGLLWLTITRQSALRQFWRRIGTLGVSGEPTFTARPRPSFSSEVPDDGAT